MTVIRPTSGWRAIDPRELWRFRDIAIFMAWRDVKVRYRQTLLGVAWAVIQPLVAMAIFTVFLGRLVGVPSNGQPYALFVYLGLLVWTYFANATTSAAQSVVTNSQLVTKVYVPRLLIPLAALLPAVVDLAIAAVLALVLMIVLGVQPQPTIVLAPLFGLLALVAALGVGTLLAALNVRYRDVRYAVPFLIQIWLFATPVVYPASIVPAEYHLLLGLNPMAGAVEGFRWSVLGGPDFPAVLVASSILSACLVLAAGLAYFRRVEREFADVI